MSEPPPAPRCRPVPTLLGAGAVVAFGTAILAPSRLWLLLIPLSFLTALYGAGRLLSRLGSGALPAIAAPSLLRTAYTLGIGLAGLAPVATLCAMSGLFRVTGAAIVACFSYGLWALSRIERRWLPRNELIASLAGGAVLGGSWLIVWLWATIPPTFYDELTYHLVIPQQALAAGQDRLLPWVYQTAMPHVSDLLLAWGMAFAGEVGARATHVSLWVLCSVGAWGLAETVAASRTAGWAGPWTIVALASSPTLWFLGTLSFAETALTAAIVIACCVLLGTPLKPSPWLALGLLLGLAAGVKLSGLAWAGAALLAGAIVGWATRDLARAGLVAVLCVIPWWIRAFLYTGNPIFPLASDIFGSPYWNAANQARLKTEIPPSIQDMSLDGWLRLPVTLVQHPEQFGSAGDAGLLAVTGIGCLAILPLLARLLGWTEQERRWADAAGAFIWLAGLAWLTTSTTIRFLAPALEVGLVGLVGMAARLSRPVQIIAAVAFVILALVGTARFIDQQENAFSATDVALGRESGTVYMARRLDHEAAARFVRETVPAEARLLFVGEARALYFAREGMAPYPVSEHPMAKWVTEAASPEALARRVADEGFTHVVLNVREFKRLHDQYGLLAFYGPDAPTLEHRLKEFPRALTPLFSKNGVYVFRVDPVRRQDSAATNDKEVTP
ncbi:MAG: hypothetical protein KGI53_07295 [Nitrospirota bacterium]|nr:hypothetical protein [Nitrospirota bacterium]